MDTRPPYRGKYSKELPMWGLAWWSKTMSSTAGSVGLIPSQRHGNPLQYSCLENPHGQRSLAGQGPYGHKELETTEATKRAHTHTHTHTRKCSKMNVTTTLIL